MRLSYLNKPCPQLVSTIYGKSPEACIQQMIASNAEGADGFCIDMGLLPLEDHNEETLRQIFDTAEGKPIYTYHYRRADRPQLTDEDLMESQLLFLRSGATLCDIMGDVFDKGAPQELTRNAEAVRRQKEYIDKVHALGGEVLMSTHVQHYITPEQVLEQALEIESRGVDVVKIVVRVTTKEQAEEAFRATSMLRHALKTPFLHLSMGELSGPHRILTPMFGSCMTLCVPYRTPLAVPEQPLLRKARAVYDNIEFGTASFPL